MENLATYLIIIWIIWICWVSFAVYYKWTKQKNKAFYALYIVLILAFGILMLNLKRPLEDGTFLATSAVIVLKHFVILMVLTAFLKVCVWWFTHKWHRRN